MSKVAKRVADSAAQATGQNHEATTPANVMQVLKPETDPEPTEQKAPTLSEIKLQAIEKFYLAEQHDNLLTQLEKLQQFAAEVGEDATLRLSSDGSKSFTSKDPQAVAQMVGICIYNIKGRIAETEAKLTA